MTKFMIWTSTISVTLVIPFSTSHKNSPLSSTHCTQWDFPNQYSTPLFFKKVTSSGSLQQQIHFLGTRLWFYFLSVDVIKEKFRSKRYLFDLINTGNMSIVVEHLSRNLKNYIYSQECKQRLYFLFPSAQTQISHINYINYNIIWSMVYS